MSRKATKFRVGRVQVYLRGQVWYLCYRELGQRHRPRIGLDKVVATQMAAQINAQLELSAPTALSFEAVPIAELRRLWLEHHEHVLRSSVQTINRYRTATEHLLKFVLNLRSAQTTSQFRLVHAEQFVRYLRSILVAPNGHKNSRQRPLLDKGIKYILQTCRSMFNFAMKRRYLPPYAENPFTALDLEKIPVQNSKPVTLLSADQERQFLEACDDWQLPMFLTLMLTGLRPGELTHLLMPEDLDLDSGILHVRNKPQLGWMVKTRNERSVPLVPPLIRMFRSILGQRITGPIFLRRRFQNGSPPVLADLPSPLLARELAERVEQIEQNTSEKLTRAKVLTQARKLWSDAGAVKPERIREEFMRLTRAIGTRELTTPKALRHLFATALQDSNVDPLIRNELMGHSPGSSRSAGSGLGMTAVYTHTRWDTKRDQLERCLADTPAFNFARSRFD